MSQVEPDAGDRPEPRADTEQGPAEAFSDTETPSAPGTLPAPRAFRAMLAVPGFRALWTGLALAAVAGWLGLAAQTTVAVRLGGTDYTRAVDGAAAVLVLRVLVPLVLGPPIAVLARRFNRRAALVGGDLLRCALFATIPFVKHLWWLLTAVALIELIAAGTRSVRQRTTAALVPRKQLPVADQLNLLTGYVTAPVGAAAFALLTLVSALIGTGSGYIRDNSAEIPLLVAALLCLLAAASSYRIPATAAEEDTTETVRPGPFAALRDGLRELGERPVRAAVVGLTGLFAAGAAVLALARPLVGDLEAGDPAYGLLITIGFVGLAPGMILAPRVLPRLSRQRLLALDVAASGVLVGLLAVIPDIGVEVVLVGALSVLGGIGWVTGRTVLTLARPDHQRARTDAFTQAYLRVVLVAAAVVTALVAGAVGRHHYEPTGHFVLIYNGAAWALLGIGVLTALSGVVAYRLGEDRESRPLRRDLLAALRGEPQPAGRRTAAGYFIALEGGEGAGKSTQIVRLAEWMRAKGHEVVITREPGATDLGRQLRQLLLDHETGRIDPRTEAMLYAADRAEHVATVIRPALERGAIVLSDRYADSSVAYQGAGRALVAADVAGLSRWATDGLVPDLTVVLDLPPEVGLARSETPPDRVEAEPGEFHERVRRGFLALAEAEPDRYLVLDATADAAQVTRRIRQRLERELPLSAREQAEQEETARRRRVEAELRRQEEAAREAEKQALIARLKAEAEEKRLEQEREAEAQRQREEAARAAEQERMRIEAERVRAEQERLRVEAERKRAEEAQRRREEEEARRRAEQRRREIEEAERRAAEAAKRAEEERRREAEEQARIAEALRVQAEQQAAEAAEAAAHDADPGDADADDPEAPDEATMLIPTHPGGEEPTPLAPPPPDAGNPTRPTPPAAADAEETKPIPPLPDGAEETKPIAPVTDAGEPTTPMAPLPDDGDETKPMAPLDDTGKPTRPIAPLPDDGDETKPIPPTTDAGEPTKPMAPLADGGEPTAPVPAVPSAPAAAPAAGAEKRRGRGRSLADDLLGPWPEE